MSPAKLGLRPEPVSTQVIPRDRHAMYFATLGVIASSIERLATEIRHLQRTEVLEAEEYFAPGQKGSSAMPHKRNPVLTENLTGLARMVRSFSIPAMEDVALWHERDISHSSVERMIGPDATVTLDFALARLTGVIDKLLVYPENMLKNLNRFRGLIHSQRVLLALTQAGVSREDAYRLVQRNAMKVWEKGADFLEELLADKEVRAALPKTRSARISTSAITPSTSTRFSSECLVRTEVGGTAPPCPSRTSPPLGGRLAAATLATIRSPHLWGRCPAGRGGREGTQALLGLTALAAGNLLITVPQGSVFSELTEASFDCISTQLSPLRDGSRRPAPGLRQELAPIWW